MRNGLTIAITSVATLFLIVLGGFSMASAQTKDDICRGAELTFADNVNCGTDATGRGYDQNNPAPQSKISGLVNQIINIFSIIVGIVAVIMIIVGGFKFITSGGDSTKVTSARNTIIYALIGLIIVALAQIIVKFVLTKVA